MEQFTYYHSHLRRFFKIYSEFISQDLYSSLRLEIEHDEESNDFKVIDSGKKVDILIYLYDLFIPILNPINGKEGIANQSFQDLQEIYENEMIKSFIDDFQNKHPESLDIKKYIFKEPFSIGSDKIEIFLKHPFFVKILDLFNESMIKVSVSLQKNEQIKKIMLSNNKIIESKGKFYFVQSLYEFHNAMSHLLVFLNTEGDALNNLNKATTHLHRGILDNYKNLIQFTNLNETQKQELVELRIKEFLSIGNDVEKNQKHEVLITYAVFLD